MEYSLYANLKKLSYSLLNRDLSLRKMSGLMEAFCTHWVSVLHFQKSCVCSRLDIVGWCCWVIHSYGKYDHKRYWCWVWMCVLMNWLKNDQQLVASADACGLGFCFAVPCWGVTEHQYRGHRSQESRRELGELGVSSGTL